MFLEDAWENTTRVNSKSTKSWQLGNKIKVEIDDQDQLRMVKTCSSQEDSSLQRAPNNFNIDLNHNIRRVTFLSYANTIIAQGVLTNESPYKTSDGKMYRVTGVPDQVVKANWRSIVEGIIELDLPAGAILDDATATVKFPQNRM